MVQIQNKSFLKFYETASKGGIEEEMKEFIDFESDNKIVKSEAYYWTKHGRVKGVLTVADTYLMYDPLFWEENQKFNQETLGSKFQACIDIQDIVNVDVIKLPNETAMYIQDEESRQWYLYDYYLQFSVSVVNAKTLKKLLGNKKSNRRRRRRRRKPVATVFFRFSHRDKDGNALRNKSQNSIVDIIRNDVVNKQKICNLKMENEETKSELTDEKNISKNKTEEVEISEKDKEGTDDLITEKSRLQSLSGGNYAEYQSSTYIPYYDKIPRDNTQNEDDEFELITEDEVSGSSPFGSMASQSRSQEERKDSIDTKPLRLPKSENHNRFTPLCSDKSKVMSETQIMLVARLLPPLFRMREWKKIYSVDEDGVSLQTFFKNARGYSSSLLFIEDCNGYKFGAYCTEDWAVHKHFYGTGESFLFTFRDSEEDIEFYRWSGYNDHIQYSDDSSIAVGGADGKFALYLRSNFLHGVSSRWRTFDNEVLSATEDFMWRHMELWGFDY